jgi:hypothetical protein
MAHYSRLCAVLIDCKTDDVDEAAAFWAAVLGRPIDPSHPGTRGNYRMLETPPDEPIVQIQRVEHESRVHLDIATKKWGQVHFLGPENEPDPFLGEAPVHNEQRVCFCY